MIKQTKLISMRRIAPKRSEECMDTVAESRRLGNRRAFDLLMEAQYYWNQMSDFRKDRERNKRYLYGDQWGDLVTVDGKTMTEEEYIKSQGNIPMKNNLIRNKVKSVLGVFRGQMKEPTCVARDRKEQRQGEVLTTLLQYNMQLNRMDTLNARTMEELMIGGFIIHRKSAGWRNGEDDCWTDYVSPNNFFIDNNMRDFRGWDVGILGEVHEISWGQLVHQFSTTPEDYRKLKEIYKWASKREFIASYAEGFGYSRLENYDFLFTSEPGRCRVIEVWRKEQKPRYRCHDYLNGEVFKIDEKDYHACVIAVNEERLRMAKESGMDVDEVPLVQATWFVDDYWYYYFLSPFGDILSEGETPYAHGSHPYVFLAYPFIDGEVHSFVGDFIDQQRYVNRLVMLHDWVVRVSAKGALLIPEDCLEGTSIEEISENWAKVNGVIVFKPSKSGQMPKQVAMNATNVGIQELLALQLKFFDDVSGVTGALQGKAGFSGQSASHYHQQVQNATMSLLDMLDSYSGFVTDAAYKDIKNIQQFYDEKKIERIVGDAVEEYDSDKVRDTMFDISISENVKTPTYRQYANDILLQLWQAQAISIEQLLEHGSFPFADDLLQSIQSQKEQVAQGQMPSGVSPEIMQQVQQGANMQAVGQLQQAMAK